MNKMRILHNARVMQSCADGKLFIDQGDGTLHEVGGGASSWNDLPDKPFYEERYVKKLYGEQTLTTEIESLAQTVLYVGDRTLDIGATYVVKVNDSTYECVAWYNEYEEANALGNGRMLGFENGDDSPFLILEMYGDVVVSFPESTSGVFSIFKKSGAVFVEQTTINAPLIATLRTELGDNAFVIEDGEAYRVFFNGTPYDCVAWYEASYAATMVGNSKFIAGSNVGNNSNNSEPFAIGVDGYGNMTIATNAAMTFTLEIYGSEYKSIDVHFLPASVLRAYDLSNIIPAGAVGDISADYTYPTKYNISNKLSVDGLKELFHLVGSAKPPFFIRGGESVSLARGGSPEEPEVSGSYTYHNVSYDRYGEPGLSERITQFYIYIEDGEVVIEMGRLNVRHTPAPM